MKTCDDIRTRIGPYLDGELDAAAEAAVRSHLESCASCAGRMKAERAFLARIAAAGRETAPASLRARVETIVRSTETGTTEPAAADRRLPWGALVPLAVAAGVAALLLVTTPWSGDPEPRAVAAAEGFAADHAAHAIERPSLQPVDFGAPDPPVIPGVELAGSSRCLIGEEPYAHYTYTVDGSHVSIYLPFDGDAPPRAGRAVEVEGVHVLGVDAIDGGAGAVIVSDDVEPAALTELWNRA